MLWLLTLLTALLLLTVHFHLREILYQARTLTNLLQNTPPPNRPKVLTPSRTRKEDRETPHPRILKLTGNRS